MNWNEGYVTDVAYTHGCYPEFSPTRIDQALTLAGHAPIPPGPCCELGFGQGVSLALHAATHPDRAFHGNDFMPQHVQHASTLLAAAGLESRLRCESFTDYCQRTDLPDFALIVLHGVWSWVSEANRQLIADFVRRKLMPGGVLYVSYNISAGWASMIPLRDLLAMHVHRTQAPSLPTSARIKQALAFADKVFAADPIAANHAPILKKRLEGLQAQDPQYLTHEFLNDDWHIGSFEGMHRMLQPAQMRYCTSAMLVEGLPSVQLTTEQRSVLADIADPVLRESTRDFFTAQPFRRDLWVRGGTTLSRADQTRAVQSLRIQWVQPPSDEPIKVRGARSEATLSEPFSGPILRALQARHAPPTIGELLSQLDSPGFPRKQVFDAITMLLASGCVVAARDAPQVDAAKPHAERLNRYLMDRADSHAEVAHLVSPVTGTGIEQSRLNQLFTAAIVAGAPSAGAAAESLAQRLAQSGERLIHEGKTIEPGIETTKAIAKHALAYDAARPTYISLGLLPAA